MRDYGLLLKTTRETQGMTQDQASDAVGVSVDTWYAYESNLRLPPLETVPRICEALDADWLAWYFQEAHAGPGNVLPPAKAMSLSEAVLTLIPRLRAFFTERKDVRLMEIAADNQVDDAEEAAYWDIVESLRGLMGAELAVVLPVKKARPDVGSSRRTGSGPQSKNDRKAIIAQRSGNVNTFRRRGGASL